MPTLSNEELKEQLDLIYSKLPITSPAQLYLRKDDDYVEGYDPVIDITVNDHSIDIQTDKYTYNHSFDAFNRIYIVPNGDEPVKLAAMGEQ